MVDLLFKKIVMAGIVAKKKKISAILKHYACTGVYLACTRTQVLVKVLVLHLNPSHRKGFVLVLVLEKFQSTCTLLKYFAPCLL